MGGSRPGAWQRTPPEKRPLGPEVRELVERFIDSHLKENTRLAYRHALEVFLGGLNALEDLKGIRPDHIEAHRNNLVRRREAETTINQHLSAIRGFFRYLVRLNLLPFNPADRGLVRFFKVDQDVSATEYLGPDEIEALLKSCDGRAPEDLRDRAIILVGLIEGLRRSEIAGLTLGSIVKNGEFWELKLHGTKGGHLQKVKLDGRAHEAIRGWLEWRRREKKEELKPHDFLFTSLSRNRSNGRPMGPKAVYEMVRRRAARAGISKNVVAHSLRHTAGTTAIKNGAPLIHVQRLMRHKDPRTTERYIHDLDTLRQSGTDYIKW